MPTRQPVTQPVTDHLTDHVTEAPVFVHLYQQLTKPPPCTPFAEVLADVLDSSDDEETNEDANKDASNDTSNTNNDTHEDDPSEDDPSDDAPPPFQTFDQLFHLHAQWLATFKALQSPSDEYVKWGKEHHTLLHPSDTPPPKPNPPKPRPILSLTNKRPSPFDDLHAQSAVDLVQKRDKQRTDALARLKTTFDTFHDDATTRAKQLRQWEEEVKGAWANVVPLLRFFGTRLDKPSVETLQWLHTQEVVPRGYLSCVDVAHSVSAYVTPYTRPVVGVSLGAHLVQAMWAWAHPSTLLQHTPFTRFALALLVLQQLHPHLRTLHTSVYAVRSDVLLSALGMWVCGAGLPAVVAWVAAAQVYVYCWADIAWCTARVGFARM